MAPRKTRSSKVAEDIELFAAAQIANAAVQATLVSTLMDKGIISNAEARGMYLDALGLLDAVPPEGKEWATSVYDLAREVLLSNLDRFDEPN